MGEANHNQVSSVYFSTIITLHGSHICTSTCVYEDEEGGLIYQRIIPNWPLVLVHHLSLLHFHIHHVLGLYEGNMTNLRTQTSMYIARSDKKLYI